MPFKKKALGTAGMLFLLSIGGLRAQEWPAWNGGSANTKYSPLRQIDAHNVQRLRLAWRYETGDAFEDSEMQCNPLIVHGRMYITSPKLRVFSLDAATGKLNWIFDPNRGAPVTGKARSRGLNYWEHGEDRRVFVASKHLLYALNADTGWPISSFGTNGAIDLHNDLDRDVSQLSIGLTSPGVVFKDMLIIGSIVSEELPAAPGHIRAYDVRTGKRRWIFHTIPFPQEPGAETWPKDAHLYLGGANDWAGMALDEKREVVYVSTGSAAMDFYGANRWGDNLYANCLLALDANTGKKLWHFQGVHHDVWDRDFPAAPTLVTVKRNGKIIDAVAQITKSGYVWVFNRDTGESLFPYENLPVAASDVDGEQLAKTQPLPLKPAPFARQQFTEELVTDRTPEAHNSVLARLRQLRSGPQFTPPSREGTVIFPGFDGGGEWGGGTYDTETGLFYVNSNEMAWILRLVPKPAERATSALALYEQNCGSCHRRDLAGSPPEFPSLKNLASRRSQQQVEEILRRGAGRMPSFAHLETAELDALVRFLMKGENKEFTQPLPKVSSPMDLKYTMDGYNKFTDPDHYPAVKPPWGTLNAIDLNSGEYVWKIPFGEIPALAAQGLKNTGSENYGGSVVTAGGLLFIGATNSDRKFHAFDKLTGKLLWEYTMDAAGNSTPATYEIKGRQFVVMGAGGGKWGNPSGGSYFVFSLPEE